MIVLFTDFGWQGPYVGQMKAVLHRQAPGVPQVDLLHNACAFEPRLAAYLLAAYVEEFPPDTVFLCVVDPGVGTDQRPPLMVEADGRWFVGPGNGLFNVVMQRARSVQAREIVWRPQSLSSTFHGRDLFAPVAATLATGRQPEAREIQLPRQPSGHWPADLDQVVWLDDFGNAFSGTRASTVAPDTLVEVSGRRLPRARTFAEVRPGEAFWYENANGLLEIAVNQGNAGEMLQLSPGTHLKFVQNQGTA